jgi:hypothetical protein
MISRNFLLSTCLAIGFAATALANTVVSSPAGEWHPFVAPNNNPGDAFWDQTSIDGANCNVGYWLQNMSWPVGGCSNVASAGSGGPGSNLSFLGAENNPAANVAWEFKASNSQAVTLLLEVAGNKDLNDLGYYTYDTNGNVVHHLLFDGSITPGGAGSTALITVGADEMFGFYLCPAGDCGATTGAKNSYANAYYSGSGLGSAAGLGKFALFSEVPAALGDLNTQITKYWVGVEDKPNGTGEGLGDFNDMLFTASVVPEPGFYAALALGLFGVFCYTWRRRQQQVESN